MDELSGIVIDITCVVFQSGKTVLANFLSDTTENVGGEYRPTQGVRYRHCNCNFAALHPVPPFWPLAQSDHWEDKSNIISNELMWWSVGLNHPWDYMIASTLPIWQADH